ncbi:MAG: hypothetical protein HZA35_03500 [Parcubacteria group bacterium]|nr:hypothetical protein [Parcubacteria group bacterium]
MKSEKTSQYENTPIKERSPEYIKILGELEHVIWATEEEQRQYIEKRIMDLSKNAKKGEISPVGHSMHEGFLGPDMKVRRNMIVDPFVMDDPRLYMDLFGILKMFKEAPGWEKKTLREIMPNAVQWALSQYFGNSVAGNNTEMQNRAFYLDHTTLGSQVISIQELAGKGFAVCAEKGAAAQNLLAFVGLESTLVASTECRIPAEANEEAHYFILLHTLRGDMIYDPTNPQMTLDKNERLISYSPAMYPVTQDQAQRLVSGESITVEHRNEKIIDDNQKIQITSHRVYTGSKK